MVLLELGLLEDVLVLLPQFGLLVEPVPLALLDLKPDALVERLGLVVLLDLQLGQVGLALLIMRGPVPLQLLLLQFIRLYLYLVRLHVILLLAQLLLDPPQLQQFGTLVELPLYLKLIFCISLS